MTISKTGLAGVALLATVVPLDAFGYTLSRVYAGADCRVTGVQANDTYTQHSFAGMTGIRNGDTVYRSMVCPAARFRSQYSKVNSAVVNVAGTGWTALDCSLTGTSQDAQTYYTAPTPTFKANTSKGTPEYIFGTWSLPAYATHAFRCAVPARGVIHKYEVGEYSNDVVGAPEHWPVTITPGSACKFYGPQGADESFDPWGGNATGMRNVLSSERRSVVCPSVRMYPVGILNNYSSIGQGAVNVSGTDWSPVDCNLHLTAWDGLTTLTAPTATLTSNSTTSTSQFFWDDIWHGQIPPYANQAYTCSVPPRRWIYKYELQECAYDLSAECQEKMDVEDDFPGVAQYWCHC